MFNYNPMNMDSLIAIGTRKIGDNDTKVVSARELHYFLEVKSRFNDWIVNRIKEYEFTEELDYVTFTKNLVKGSKQTGRPTVEYAITLDMAKETPNTCAS